MTTTTDSVQIGIEELATIKTIIETASSRGAFKADELQAVGTVYNKLTAFLEHVLAEAEAHAEAQAKALAEAQAHTHEHQTNKGETQ